MAARVVHLAISDGGVPKISQPELMISHAGVEGDRQAHPAVHGGPERAVCLLAAEVIDALRAAGHPIRPGSTGENITVLGLEWQHLAPGDLLRFEGGVTIQIVEGASPCGAIAGSFSDGDVMRLDPQRGDGNTRWYARVDTPGVLAVGATCTRVAGSAS